MEIGTDSLVSSTVKYLAVFAVAVLSLYAQAQDMQQGTAPQGSVKLQPMNVKTGLWETTVTYTTSGQMPIPPGMLAKLTPEQRARLEAGMKQNSGGRSSTETEKRCLRKEELEKPDFGGRKGDCTETVISSTSTMAKGNLSCDIEGMRMTGMLEIDAIDQEHVKGSYHSTATGGSQAMKVESTFTSKWLSPNCGNVE